MIKAPDYVLGVSAYVPGKPIEELERELGITGSVKLASNENPAGPSRLALAALTDKSRLEDLNRYPDGGGYYLKKKLAVSLSGNGIDAGMDSLILGNGSNELLDIAVRTFMAPGDEAVMAAPSFAVYGMSVRLQGGIPVEVPLRHYRHDLDAMARAVTPKTKMLFIANPNNPTGTINTKEEYDRLFFESGLPEDVLVVLDEAYCEYVDNPSYPDSLDYLFRRKKKNVLILRTFSKIYGLAGLRMGYGISHPGILAQMNRVRPPFNTGSLSQAAAIAALDDSGHVGRSRALNDEGRKFLYRELSAMGMEYVPTEANFIYMPVEDAQGIFISLLKEGVIIRPMGRKALRVTIGLPSENERFVNALKKVKRAMLP